MVSNWLRSISRIRCGNSIVMTPAGAKSARSPRTKSLMSGTWASTLLPSTRSAAPNSAAIARPVASPRKSTRVGTPRASAARATLAAGSMPSTGTPAATKCCSR